MRRELFQDICRSHGLNITVEPRPQRMKHKSTRDYKRQQAELEAEKPVALMVSIIEYISLPDELLLDQFGGSGNFGIACLNTNRNAIIVEKDEQTFERMKDNIVNTMKDKSEASISIKEVDLDEDMDMEMELM